MTKKPTELFARLAAMLAIASVPIERQFQPINHPLAHLKNDEERIRLAAEKRGRRKERNGRNLERMEAGRQKYLNRKMGVEQ